MLGVLDHITYKRTWYDNDITWAKTCTYMYTCTHTHTHTRGRTSHQQISCTHASTRTHMVRCRIMYTRATLSICVYSYRNVLGYAYCNIFICSKCSCSMLPLPRHPPTPVVAMSIRPRSCELLACATRTNAWLSEAFKSGTDLAIGTGSSNQLYSPVPGRVVQTSLWTSHLLIGLYRAHCSAHPAHTVWCNSGGVPVIGHSDSDMTLWEYATVSASSETHWSSSKVVDQSHLMLWSLLCYSRLLLCHSIKLWTLGEDRDRGGGEALSSNLAVVESAV